MMFLNLPTPQLKIIIVEFWKKFTPFSAHMNPTITYCRHVQRGATWKTSTYMCGGISWYKKLPKCYEVVIQRTKKRILNIFLFLNVLNIANKVVN